MKKIISTIAALVLVLSLSTVAFAEEQVSTIESSVKDIESTDLKSFDDVTADGSFKWAYTQIMAMAQAGYISGTRPVDTNGVGSYSPKSNITVDQFVAIAVRRAYPGEVDAATGDWSAKARQVAVAHNIISKDSYQGSAFKNNITREEMTMIMIRCLESQGIKTYSDVAGVKTALADFSEIGGNYRSYVATAYTMGIMQGKGNGIFDPVGNATRAEAAVILYRCIDANNRKDADFTTVVTPPVTPPVTGSQKWVEGQAHSEPKAGDIVIKDGKEIVLKATLVGDIYILGYNQGVDHITGLTINGNVRTADKMGGAWHGYQAGDLTAFVKDPITGSVFTKYEWGRIKLNTFPDYTGTKEGERANTYFVWDTVIDDWAWVGPSQSWLGK